jgi:hypothetical protein
MNRSVWLLAVAITLGTTCASASDLNPLGFYVGGGVGQADDPYTAFGVSERDTGWKVMAGLRPVPFLGAELEYSDYGNERFFLPQFSPVGQGFAGTGHTTGEGLFAVGYLPLIPLPVPILDLFAKVGGERVHTNGSGQDQCVPVSPGAPTCLVIVPTHADLSETDFAYGVGVQSRLQALGLRVEYERTDTSFGHPGLLSFGVTWTF